MPRRLQPDESEQVRLANADWKSMSNRLVAVNARVRDLQRENERLRERVRELEAAVDKDDGR